jgi:hypothetical protein
VVAADSATAAILAGAPHMAVASEHTLPGTFVALLTAGRLLLARLFSSASSPTSSQVLVGFLRRWFSRHRGAR